MYAGSVVGQQRTRSGMPTAYGDSVAADVCVEAAGGVLAVARRATGDARRPAERRREGLGTGTGTPARVAREARGAAGDRLPVARVRVEPGRRHSLALQIRDLALEFGDVVGGVRLP